jgi:peptidoglycan hydrolase CwlO-like protein
MQRNLAFRRGLIAAAIAVSSVALAAPAASSGDLTSRAQSLEQGIGGDTGRIQAFQGRVSDLEARLSSIESSLAVQQALLNRFQTELRAARARLLYLQQQLANDRRMLAAQLVSQYESPSTNAVSVLLSAHGFADLLERVDQMKLLARHNASILQQVITARAQVAVQTAQLDEAQARQQRVTSAVLVERDQVDAIKLSVLEQERVAESARARKQAELDSVRHRLAVLQAQAAAAQGTSFANSAPAGAGYTGGAYAPHSGDFGFFPAPGTNYSVGEEPQIAARLDALGKALHLHLIGISGYRSPQHSVEVGGFANDPHTRGEASDTPGVEGVSEATLNRFGLTRPFPGAAEADHIQLA